jgi:hypothetical protein
LEQVYASNAALMDYARARAELVRL